MALSRVGGGLNWAPIDNLAQARSSSGAIVSASLAHWNLTGAPEPPGWPSQGRVSCPNPCRGSSAACWRPTPLRSVRRGHPSLRKISRFRLGNTKARSPDGSHIDGPFKAHSFCGVRIMNIQVRRADALSNSQVPSSFFAAILRVFVAILSSPKGDQGGWEGGARGL